MNGWMQSQHAFVSSLCPKTCDDGPLQACEVLRPVGREQPQILLLKQDDAGLVKFGLHVQSTEEVWSKSRVARENSK